MKKTVLFYLLIVTILLGACSSVGVKLGPSFTEWDTGEHRQYVKVTFVNTHTFSPSTTTTMMLECRDLRGIRGLEGKTAEEVLSKLQCRPSDVGNHDAGVGVFAGFGNAIVQSLTIVGSSALISEALRQSGDTHSSETNVTDRSITRVTDESVSRTSIRVDPPSVNPPSQ